MFFARKLVLICLEYNSFASYAYIYPRVTSRGLKWENKTYKVKMSIAGVKNRLADSLSRLQVQSFKQLAPAHMDRLPTEIPLHLQPQSWQP